MSHGSLTQGHPLGSVCRSARGATVRASRGGRATAVGAPTTTRVKRCRRPVRRAGCRHLQAQAFPRCDGRGDLQDLCWRRRASLLVITQVCARRRTCAAFPVHRLRVLAPACTRYAHRPGRGRACASRSCCRPLPPADPHSPVPQTARAAGAMPAADEGLAADAPTRPMAGRVLHSKLSTPDVTLGR